MVARVIVLSVAALAVVAIGSVALNGWEFLKTSAKVNTLVKGRDLKPLFPQADANTPADYAVATGSAYVSGAPAARTLTVAWTVNLQGVATSARHTDLLFLCSGPTFDTCGPEPIGAAAIDEPLPQLVFARTYSRSVTIPLPAVAPGTYYVHVFVDAPDGENGEAVQEADESNNTRAMRVTITGR